MVCERVVVDPAHQSPALLEPRPQLYDRRGQRQCDVLYRHHLLNGAEVAPDQLCVILAHNARAQGPIDLGTEATPGV